MTLLVFFDRVAQGDALLMAQVGWSSESVSPLRLRFPAGCLYLQKKKTHRVVGFCSAFGLGFELSK